METQLQVATDPQTKPSDLGCEFVCRFGECMAELTQALQWKCAACTEGLCSTVGVILNSRGVIQSVTEYTLWVNKKQATIILPITLPNVDWFSKFFTSRDISKFATKHLLIIPSHLNCVATLPCEISELKNCHAQDLSLWSKLSCKPQPLRRVVKIPYSHFSII